MDVDILFIFSTKLFITYPSLFQIFFAKSAVRILSALNICRVLITSKGCKNKLLNTAAAPNLSIANILNNMLYKYNFMSLVVVRVDVLGLKIFIFSVLIFCWAQHFVLYYCKYNVRRRRWLPVLHVLFTEMPGQIFIGPRFNFNWFAYVSWWIVVAIHWQWWTTAFGLANTIIFNFIVLMIVVSWGRTIFSDPGYNSPGWVSHCKITKYNGIIYFINWQPWHNY